MSDTNYSNDIAQLMPGNNMQPPLYSSVSGDSIVDRDSSGVIQAIKLDMTKAKNTFVDLRPIFNANQVDGNIVMPIQPYQYGQPVDLTKDWNCEIHGYYPDKKTSFVLNTSLGNTGTIFRIVWQSGVFQATGKYTFQFVFINKHTGATMASKWCFFDVEPDILSMAVDYVDGISPFNSEYEAWKAKFEQEVEKLQNTANTVGKTLDDIKGIAQNYESNVQSAVDTGWQNKLDSENTWTGKQHFNGGLTASTLQGDNLNIGSSVSLPGNTTLNSDVLKYENGNLAQGLFPCEGYWFATSSGKSAASSLLNGVTGYISCKKFHYTPRDGDVECGLMEIHMNCNIPTSAFGKPVIQFAGDFNGIDQTPFAMGGHIFQFDASAKTLNCNGYIPGNSSTSAMDASMI